VALRVVIADDHTIVRQGIRVLLCASGEVTVVGEAGRVDEIGPLLGDCDVLLLDLNMDRSSLASVPEFARRTRVLLLTMNETTEDTLAAVQAGARAVVFKRFALDTLLDAIRAVAAGHVWLPPSLQAAALVPRPVAERVLSAREQEVVDHVALGMRNAEIARTLFISEETVKKHLNNVFQKLGLRDRVQLTLWAIASGLASPRVGRS
jgi:DNA-binding NarL/FixJ family response regulator